MRQMFIEYLEKKLKETNEKAREIERSITLVRSFSDSDESQYAERSIPAAPVREAVCNILRNTGYPLDRDSIFHALQTRGIEVGGKVPRQTLSAHMSNDPRIESLGEGQWGLVEWRSQGSRNKLFANAVEMARQVAASEVPVPRFEHMDTASPHARNHTTASRHAHLVRARKTPPIEPVRRRPIIEREHSSSDVGSEDLPF